MEIKTRPFDPARYIDSEEAAAVYMTEALATNDVAFIADALDIVARARGPGHMARATGLTHENPDGSLDLGALSRALSALGLRLEIRPAKQEPAELPA